MSKSKRYFNPGQDDLYWSQLLKQHLHDMHSLDAVSTMWQAGFDALNINPQILPKAIILTESLLAHTGYTFVQTQDHIIHPQREWYGMIAEYQMPLTCFIRTPEELGYCDEPDIWHDIMGHIPFLVNPQYSEMYQLCLLYTSPSPRDS